MSDIETPEEPLASDAPAAEAPTPGLKSVEEWASEKGLRPYKFAAAKGMFRWGFGKQMTEAEFDAAVKEAMGATMTAGNPFLPPQPKKNKKRR